MAFKEPPSKPRLKKGRAWLKWLRRDAQLYAAYRNAGPAQRGAARRAWRDHAITQPKAPPDDVLEWIRAHD